MSQSQELVGLEVVEKSVALEGQDLVAKVAAQHVGKIGSLKVSVEGKFEFLSLVNKAIDKIEEIIPGDQKAVASLLKGAISQIKIKL